MNNICLFGVRVSSEIKTKEISTGPMVWFGIGEKLGTVWQNYLVTAYGEKLNSTIKKMKLKVGSNVNIIGELHLSDNGAKIVVSDIAYSNALYSSDKKEEAKDTPVVSETSEINLDSEDPFLASGLNEDIFN